MIWWNHCRVFGAVLVALLVGVASSSPATAAQSGDAGAPADTALILVRVVDAQTNAPIDGAVVRLSRVGPGTQIPRQTTDPRGRALFPSLSPGRYRLTASAAQYMDGMFGEHTPGNPMERGGTGMEGAIEVAQGAAPRDVDVRLWRYSRISGRVLDHDGEPLIGASVSVAQLGEALGIVMRPRGRTGGRTNDRGEYTVDNLMPGDYIVGVESGRPLAPGISSRTVAAVVRPTVYFGDVFTPGLAPRVVLGAGATREQVDITIPSVPLLRVSGRVSGADGKAATLQLRLVPAEADDEAIEVLPPTAATNPDATGAFTFAGVPAGDYIVYAAQGSAAQGMIMTQRFPGIAASGSEPAPVVRLTNQGTPSDTIAWARTPVFVGDRDVTDLDVTLRPGVNLRARIVVDTRSGTAADASKLSIRLQPLSVPQTGAGMRGTSTLTPVGGELVSAPLLPGTYGLDLAGGSGPVLSELRVNGRSQPGRVIELRDDTSVEVVVTDRLGTVQGKAADASSAVIFPADPDAWRFAAGDRARTKQVEVDTTGGFSFSGLPIGDYVVVASRDGFSRTWAQPASLDILAKRGKRVTVRERQTTDVSVRPAALP